MKKYANVIMGKDARQQKLYESGLFILQVTINQHAFASRFLQIAQIILVLFNE